jgi:hypothetical protein
MRQSRPDNPETSTLYVRLSVGLFATVTIIVVLTFQHYGISWDEFLQHDYGEAVLRFYTSFLHDRSSISAVGNLSNYGGLFEILCVLATRVSPFGVYETRHLLTALFGITGILAAWRIACSVAGPGAGFWTAFLLAFYPPYYGHMFINSKDIPFAVGYAWALYYLLKVQREFPNLTAKSVVKLGLAMGFTMAVRVGGLILLCYLYLFCAVWLLDSLWRNKDSFRSFFPIASKTLLGAIAATVIAYGVMVLFWPYAVNKPFINPFNALGSLSHVEGGFSESDYLPRHLLFKLPELTLVLVSVGSFLGVRALLGRRVSLATALSYLMLILSVMVPFVYTVLTHPGLYDEIRHFLFIVPPVFCLAGITLSRILSRFSAGSMRLWQKAVVALLGVYLLLHIRLVVQLHPYEYVYYNRLLGGVSGAHQKNYATEYWATSYREGVHKLEAYLRARDGANFEKTQYKIFGGPAIWCGSYYFPKNFVSVPEAKEADAYLATTRYGTEQFHGEQTVIEVRRFGVPFMVGKILAGHGK